MPPTAPASPDPQFDFMLKNNQAPKKGLRLPGLNLSKPIKIMLGVVLGIVLLIIVSSVLSGNKGGATQPIIGVMARGQEIIRVTQLAQPNLKDSATQALAATVYGTLSSDQQQLSAYMTSNKNKVSTLQLAADLDKTVDTQLQTASMNNNLDLIYRTYLTNALAKYQTNLQTAYNAAGPKGKDILKEANTNTQTILQSAPLK